MQKEGGQILLKPQGGARREPVLGEMGTKGGVSRENLAQPCNKRRKTSSIRFETQGRRRRLGGQVFHKAGKCVKKIPTSEVEWKREKPAGTLLLKSEGKREGAEGGGANGKKQKKKLSVTEKDGRRKKEFGRELFPTRKTKALRPA